MTTVIGCDWLVVGGELWQDIFEICPLASLSSLKNIIFTLTYGDLYGGTWHRACTRGARWCYSSRGMSCRRCALDNLSSLGDARLYYAVCTAVFTALKKNNADLGRIRDAIRS